MLSYHRQRYGVQSMAYVVLFLLVSCNTGSRQPKSPATAATVGSETQTVVASQQPLSPRFFAVDTLVRSTQLAGVDLHVRYIERTPTSLVLHIAFYNNGSSDLAFVSGATPSGAQLIGSTTAKPTALSPSLQGGIAPAGTWLVNGANNGTLSFPPLPDDRLSFVFPGFPTVPIRLTLPLREAPEPPPPAPDHYRFAWEVAATQQVGRVLRINAVTITTTALIVEVSLLNRGTVTASQPLLLRDIVLLDGRWSQLHPQTAAGALGAKQVVDGNVVLTFPRPVAGDSVFLRVTDFPLIRIPLHPDDVPAVAAQSDLPPSSRPHPTPSPSSQPSPAHDEAQAQHDVQQLLDQISRAVAERDRVAYLAAFAAELQQTESAAFDQIMHLPLQDLQWTLASRPGGNGSSVRASFNDVPVTLRYAIQDIDPANVFVNELRLSFRHDANWHITAVAGELPFWSYASTAAERVGPFWIFFRPEARTELPSLAAEARRSFEQVARALPGRVKAVNVMLVTSTGEEFTNLTGRSGDSFAGVALSRFQVNATGITITNQAFFLNGAAFARPQSQNREQTIIHEFTHLVLAPTTMPFMPAWLVEGAAMDLSADFPHEALKTWLHAHPEGVKLDDFSAVTGFGQGDNSEQTLVQYGCAAYLTKYLIEVYGMDRFLALYDSFSMTPLPEIQGALALATDAEGRNGALSQLARRLTPINVQAVLGIDLASLEHNFNVWLGQTIKSDT